MTALKNSQHELFAQGLASGLSAIDAYEQAGYEPFTSSATRLSKNKNVVARVDELKIKASAMADIDRARVLRELQEIAEDAKAAGQYGPAATVWIKLGVDIGMFETTSNVNVNHIDDKAETLTAARERAKSKMNGHYKH